MCGRQRCGMVAQVILAELAGGIAEIVQKLGERRRTGPQIRRATGKLWWNHAGAQRMHSGEKSVASGGAALLGIIGHEFSAFAPDAVDIWRFSDHQSFMVDARLHDADIVAHDEQYVRLRLLLRGSSCARQSRSANHGNKRD
jgi:hypothetical protein